MTAETRKKIGRYLAAALALAGVFAFIPWPYQQHSQIGSACIMLAIISFMVAGHDAKTSASRASGTSCSTGDDS